MVADASWATGGGRAGLLHTVPWPLPVRAEVPARRDGQGGTAGRGRRPHSPRLGPRDHPRHSRSRACEDADPAVRLFVVKLVRAQRQRDGADTKDGPGAHDHRPGTADVHQTAAAGGPSVSSHVTRPGGTTAQAPSRDVAGMARCSAMELPPSTTRYCPVM